MDFHLMPDTEALALDALRHYMADDGVTFVVEPQTGWSGELPFAVVYKVDGSAIDERLIDESVLSVTFVASDRKTASTLSRKGHAYLRQAAMDNFSTAEGVIVGFRTIKDPVTVHDGLTGKHADSVAFDATYVVRARAHY